MKVFVTGATGYIGSAVSSTLARAGHEVFGLARSEAKGRALAAQEILPVRGDMAEPESFAAAAAGCQALVHCAAEESERFHALDRRTIDVLLRAVREAESPRMVVYTSGVWLYGDTGAGVADESSPLQPPAMVAPRADTERLVLAATGGDVRTIVMRPGCVYGGSGGLTGMWFASASNEGAARIVGQGDGAWTMVHVADLADAYLRVVESAFGGEVFNVTDRSRNSVRSCAEVASRVAGGGGRVRVVSEADAAKEMGAIAECLAMTQHVDSSKAARLLGWQPRHGGFVDGVPRYHAAWKATVAR